MGCLKVYKIEKEKIMSKKSKEEKNQKFCEESKLEKTNSKNNKRNYIQMVWKIIAAIGSLILGLVALNTYIDNKFDHYVSKENYSEFKDAMKSVKDDVKKINEHVYENGGIDTKLDQIMEALHMKVINADDKVAEDISIEQNDTPTVGSGFSADTVIGTDADGQVYIASSLIGETIILTYHEEGKEVYFLGQYDEKYHWDGECLTNVYNEDGTLFGMCKFNMNDGECQKWVSFNQDGEKEFVYTNRQKTSDGNLGQTIRYQVEDSKQKNFTSTNVRRQDFIWPDEYRDKVTKRMTSFYCGQTQNGYLNDQTGNAFQILFDEDQTVKSIYMGNFVNGYHVDETEKAWEISYSEENQSYIYYIGNFENGYAVEGTKQKLDIAQIQEIILPYSFDCELKWKE